MTAFNTSIDPDLLGAADLLDGGGGGSGFDPDIEGAAALLSGESAAQPEQPHAVFDSLVKGMAAQVPMAMAQTATLARSGLEAVRNPIPTALRAVGGAIRLGSDPVGTITNTPAPSMSPAAVGGYVADQMDAGAAAFPSKPPNLVEQSVSQALDDMASTGRAMTRVAEFTADPRTKIPFTRENIAWGIGGSIPQMGTSIVGGMGGGLVLGPPGAFLGAFAPSLLTEMGSIAEDTYQRTKEQNPQMSDEEALQRAFGSALVWGVPAAALDAGTGGEAAAAKAAVQSTIENTAKTLTQRVLKAGGTIGKAMLEEAVTEPIQGTLEDLGGVMVAPPTTAPTTEDVQNFAVKRGMEATVGGLMGAGGGTVGAVQTDFANRPTPKAKQETVDTAVKAVASSGGTLVVDGKTLVQDGKVVNEPAQPVADAAPLPPTPPPSPASSLLDDFIAQREAGMRGESAGSPVPPTKDAPAPEPAPAAESPEFQTLRDAGFDPEAIQQRVEAARAEQAAQLEREVDPNRPAQERQAALEVELQQRAAQIEAAGGPLGERLARAALDEPASITPIERPQAAANADVAAPVFDETPAAPESNTSPESEQDATQVVSGPAPWEMTRDEYRSYNEPTMNFAAASRLSSRPQFVRDSAHRAIVEAAIRLKKPVPARVLADYPDLAASPNAPSRTEPTTPAIAGRIGAASIDGPPNISTLKRPALQEIARGLGINEKQTAPKLRRAIEAARAASPTAGPATQPTTSPSGLRAAEPAAIAATASSAQPVPQVETSQAAPIAQTPLGPKGVQSESGASSQSTAPDDAYEHDPAESNWTPQERRARRQITNLSKNLDKAAAEYAKLSDSYGGRVFATDVARELADGYRTPEGRRVLTKATKDPASEVAGKLYEREMARRKAAGETGVVLMTGGGAGSGKTTTIEQALKDGADVIYDSQMVNADSAIRRIENALAQDDEVYVRYVHRPFAEAASGSFKRAKKIGRYNTLHGLAEAHVEAQDAIAKVAERFKDDPRVAVTVVDNSQEPGLQAPTPQDFAPGGRLRYGGIDELIPIARREFEAAAKSGTLDADLQEKIAGGVGRDQGKAAPGGEGKPAKGGRGRKGRGSSQQAASVSESSTEEGGPTSAGGNPASPARNLTDRLDKFADERRRSFRRRMGLDGGPDGITKRMSGVDPLALYDAAAWLGALAVRANIRGGKALTKFIAEKVAEARTRGLKLPEDLKRLRQVVKGYIDDAGGENATEQEVMNVYERGREEAAIKRVSKAARNPKQTIGAQTGITDTSETVTESQALKASTSRAAKAARSAYSYGRKLGREQARFDLQELRRRLTDKARRNNQIAKIKERGEKDAAVAAVEAKRRVENGVRKQAVRIIKEHLPRELWGSYITDIRDATSTLKLARLLNNVQRDLATYEIRRGIKAIEREVGSERSQLELEPELKDMMDQAVGALARLKRMLVRGGVITPARANAIQASAGTTAAPVAPSQRLSVADLEVMRDELDSIANAVYSARFQQKSLDQVRIKGELKEAGAIRQDIAGRVNEGQELDKGDTPQAREPGWVKRVIRRRTNWDVMMRMLDGFKPGGAAVRLFNEVLRGRARALKLDQVFRDQLGEIAKKHGYTSLGQAMAEMSGTLGEGLQKSVDVKVGGFDKLTLGQAAYIYASSTDQGFLNRIDRGQPLQFREARTDETFKLTRDDIQKVADALPGNVKAFIDDAKALYDSHYFDGLSRTNKLLKGYRLKKVLGYWGLKLNRDFSELRGVPTSWRGNFIRAQEESGFMQERLGPSKTPILIGDFGTDLMLRSKSAATVIGKAQTTKLLTQTLLHPEVVTAITKRFGADTVERIKRRIALYSGGDIHNPTDSAARKLLSMWARSKTQLWAWTWLRNGLGGAVRVMNEIGATDLAKAGLTPSWDAWQRLKRHSPELRERWDSGGVGSFYDASGADVAGASLKEAAGATIKNLFDSLESVPRLDARGILQGGKGAWKSWGRVLDALTVGNFFDAVGAIIAFKHFLKQAPPNLDAEAKDKWAARHATRVFERVSNTATIEYANDVQLAARDSLWMASLVPFTGDTAKAQSMIFDAWGRARKNGEWGRVAKVVSTLGLSAGLSALVSLIRGLSLGDDDDKAMLAAGRRLLQEITSLAPGGTVLSPVGNKVYDMMVGTKTHDPSVLDIPLVEMLNTGWGIVGDVIEGVRREGQPQKNRKMLRSIDLYTRALENAAKTGGEVFGFPTQYWDELKRGVRGWSTASAR